MQTGLFIILFIPFLGALVCVYMLIRNEVVYKERGVWLDEWGRHLDRKENTKKPTKLKRYREAFESISYNEMMYSFRPMSYFRGIFRNIVETK